MKRNLLLLFYLLAGVVLGGLLASACSGVPFLSWLSYSASIGFNPNNPFILDLAVLQLSFGFGLNISVAQIITVALALYLYSRARIR